MKSGLRDISTGIILFAFSIFGFLSANGFSNPNTSYGPDFFPKLILIALTVLSFALTIKGFFDFKKDDSRPHIDKKMVMLIIAYIILLIVYINLFFMTGFIISTIIFLIIAQYLFGLRKWFTIILVSIIVPFSLYYIFTALFNIPLP